ncbi:MAG TPA: translation initiation factor IF-1 [Patescibacteria group bacterium]|nr:translation initiation factor IF-1 [Patescibacteria group bacterium]
MKTTNTEIFEGEVREALPNTMFRIVLADGRVILATLTGKMRRGFVRVFPGDRVKVEMTPYDKDRGRIVWKR